MTIPDGCPIDYMHCILQGMYHYLQVYNNSFLLTMLKRIGKLIHVVLINYNDTQELPNG